MARNSVRNSLAALIVASQALAAACPSEDAMAPGSTAPPPTPTPTAVVVVSGGGQSGTVDQALTNPIVVQVNDQLGSAMQSIEVSFTVAQGGGTVAAATKLTDVNGQASTTWTLGTGAGSSQQVTAAVASNTNVNATINATATADVAAALVEVSGNTQTQQIGAALPNDIVVRVDDQFLNPVQGHGVDFVVTLGTGSLNGMGSPVTVTTGANGEAAVQWTLGPEQPTQTVEARATGLSPVAFTANVTGSAPASVLVSAGDGQTGLVGNQVNIAPAVLVEDAAGFPFPGAQVTFAVASGGGMASGLMATTDASGIATLGGWTLGAAAGANTLTATVTGTGITGNPRTFTATGAIAAFDIVLDYVTTATPAQMAAFSTAEAAWENLVFGDLPSQLVNVPADFCFGNTHPAVNETVDDVKILVLLEPIDGPGQILGQAGFCLSRSGSRLPALGLMLFDTADLATLEMNGQLTTVILHEMGHVLGVGTLWDDPQFNFLQNPAVPSPCPMTLEDTHFTGPLAIAAFNDVGGTTYTLGSKVPAENDCAAFGLGSLNGHWRESVLDAELMTPQVNSGMANPLSVVTIASLGDLGYAVNYSGADTYTFPGPLAILGAGAGGGFSLEGDLLLGPIHVVDPTGRVVEVLERF